MATDTALEAAPSTLFMGLATGLTHTFTVVPVPHRQFQLSANNWHNILLIVRQTTDAICH